MLIEVKQNLDDTEVQVLQMLDTGIQCEQQFVKLLFSNSADQMDSSVQSKVFKMLDMQQSQVGQLLQ